MEIKIEKNVNKDRLKELGVENWPIWEKEISEFPWSYDTTETCYIIEGEVEVVPEEGEAVRFEAGDLVVFPEGMSCTWNIKKPVRKHYRFG